MSAPPLPSKVPGAAMGVGQGPRRGSHTSKPVPPKAAGPKPPPVGPKPTTRPKPLATARSSSHASSRPGNPGEGKLPPPRPPPPAAGAPPVTSPKNDSAAVLTPASSPLPPGASPGSDRADAPVVPPARTASLGVHSPAKGETGASAPPSDAAQADIGARFTSPESYALAAALVGTPEGERSVVLKKTLGGTADDDATPSPRASTFAERRPDVISFINAQYSAHSHVEVDDSDVDDAAADVGLADPEAVADANAAAAQLARQRATTAASAGKAKKKKKKAKRRKRGGVGRFQGVSDDRPLTSTSGEAFTKLRKPKLLRQTATHVPDLLPIGAAAPSQAFAVDDSYESSSSTSSGTVHRHRIRHNMRDVQDEVAELHQAVSRISSQHSKMMRGKQLFAFRLFKREKRVLRAENDYLRDRVKMLEDSVDKLREQQVVMTTEIETYRQTVENLGQQFAETVLTIQAQHEMFLARQEVVMDYEKTIADHYYYLRQRAEEENPSPLAGALANQNQSHSTTSLTSHPSGELSASETAGESTAAALAVAMASSNAPPTGVDSTGSPFCVPEGMCWVCNKLLNGDETTVKGHTIHRSKKTCLRLLPAKLKEEKAFLAAAASNVSIDDELNDAMNMLMDASDASVDSVPPSVLTLNMSSSATPPLSGSESRRRSATIVRMPQFSPSLEPSSPAHGSAPPSPADSSGTDRDESPARMANSRQMRAGTKRSSTVAARPNRPALTLDQPAVVPQTTEFELESETEKRSFRVAGPVNTVAERQLLKFVSTCSPQNLLDVRCSGWLGKRKGKVSKSFTKMFGWNRRFFVQHSNYLTYFRNESSKSPLWSIPLRNTTLETAILSKKHLITLSNPVFERMFQFMAYSQRDYDIWCEVLAKAISQANSPEAKLDHLAVAPSGGDDGKHAAVKRVSVDLSSNTGTTSEDLLSSPDASPACSPPSSPRSSAERVPAPVVVTPEVGGSEGPPPALPSRQPGKRRRVTMRSAPGSRPLPGTPPGPPPKPLSTGSSGSAGSAGSGEQAASESEASVPSTVDDDNDDDDDDDDDDDEDVDAGAHSGPGSSKPRVLPLVARGGRFRTRSTTLGGAPSRAIPPPKPSPPPSKPRRPPSQVLEQVAALKARRPPSGSGGSGSVGDALDAGGSDCAAAAEKSPPSTEPSPTPAKEVDHELEVPRKDAQLISEAVVAKEEEAKPLQVGEGQGGLDLEEFGF
ncbi:uncharacterized protein AMSG_04432 [Thecamonas trahens ATCC 50062]|uniref:PH domain-containing protein n=1 Tax=Thecamonas trahens ATCC 50062 TaxID=461836 RepID=A0A0L0DA82_THETB|nr:hypothetical protein AMSG_04432 [Thecamonas trahens ATCC 50062]KNC48203.1 hypothetical protein AMSG_04432 [Thecamonas trahens ATCC 50062]|eukprot:XP_013758772.1 hypothetical protein AMSG_04432 [Thecamonas trahens ATCC 50062]